MQSNVPAVSSPAIVVSEVFGPTMQGEGASLGIRAGFVRLGGCNLHCKWCDTAYTWDASRYNLREELTARPVAGIINQVRDMTPRVIVVTGGEPLLWQHRSPWRPLIAGLDGIAPVEVETNGTRIPDTTIPVTRYTVSPKLSSAGDPVKDRLVRPALDAFAALAHQGKALLKVVVKTSADVRTAGRLARLLGWPERHVYVMPEGTDVETIVNRHRLLADVVTAEGLNMTTRLHVLAWGTERAR